MSVIFWMRTTVNQGCPEYTSTELIEHPGLSQGWEYVKVQGVKIIATLSDLRMGFPRSTNVSGHTPETITAEPTEGDAGVTKAITGQNEANKSNENAEKFLDHNEHAHSGPNGTIPLLPGVASELAKTLTAKNTTLKELTFEQTEEIAEECVRDLLEAGETEAKGVSDCETLPVFLSGNDVSAATKHDLKAINPLEGGVPAWVKLNYESAKSKEERGEKRNWYVGLGGCAEAKPAGKQCDEYPFFASKQGGPGAFITPSLEYIDEADNEKQGSRYGGFVTSCKMSERTATEYAFLAIPLDPVLKIPTTYACN